MDICHERLLIFYKAIYNRDMEKDYGDRLAKALTRIGAILTKSGADVHRVEDTMQRICKAYGAGVIDAYVTPSLLIISFSFEDREGLFHNIKRIYTSSYDLNKIDVINTLSREICAQPIALDELDKRLDAIENAEGYSDRIIILAAAIASFSFGFIFGGGIYEALCSLVVGAIVMAFDKLVSKIELGSFLKNMFSGAILTTLSMLISSILPVDRDIIIIASIMLLVPGLIITNAVRDSVNGDLISGITRAIEAIFIAVAVSLGSGVVLLIGGV